MTKLVCTTCGTLHKAPFTPEPRDRACPCGGVRVLPSQTKPRKPLNQASPNREKQVRKQGGTLKRSQPKRDWGDARAKVDEEGCCRICKRSDRPLEACHVLGREHDQPRVSEATGEVLQELYVHPDRIFPGCGPFPEGCHGDVDMRRINVLPYLTLDEQIQAVKDAGGIAPAMMRLAPVDHREEVEASRVAAHA